MLSITRRLTTNTTSILWFLIWFVVQDVSLASVGGGGAQLVGSHDTRDAQDVSSPVSSAGSSTTSTTTTTTTLRDMLNDMAQYFDKDEFPEQSYQTLVDCFHQYDDEDTSSSQSVLESQNKAWDEFYLHYVNNATNIYAATEWGGFPSKFRESQNSTEHKAMFGPGRNQHKNDEDSGSSAGQQQRVYRIEEVCNYVSNVAMYSSAIRVCEKSQKTTATQSWDSISPQYQEAVMKLFATLGVSSSWFHGSMMPVGGRWDGVAVALAVHMAYRIVIDPLLAEAAGGSKSSRSATILQTISPPHTDQDLPVIPTIVELVDRITFLPLNSTMIPAEWFDYLTNDMEFNQDPASSVLGFVATNCAMMYRFWFCRLLLGDMLGPLILTNETTANFFRNQYLPELQTLLYDDIGMDLPLSLWQKPKVGNRGIGLGLSLLWSVMFQESVIQPFDLLLNKNSTSLGATLSPLMDKIVSKFTKMETSSNSHHNFYADGEVYPGATFCNQHSSHALWHQLSADSLFELFVVADEMAGLLQDRIAHRRQKQQRQGRFGGLSFYEAIHYDGPPLHLRNRRHQN